VRVGAGNLEYYVYVEDSDAGVFYPERAEHEFLSAPVAGTVVINEVMADNVHAARDPNGQYDDWIELHNNRASSLALDGYFLTDDSADLLMWQFPYVTIPADGYMIVWADADTGQTGLHANFRLNELGEVLVLTDPDGHPCDRVVFGPQAPDISFGRFPDGTGQFMLMDPTFGAANDSGVAIEEPGPARSPRLTAGAFPNPFAGATTVRYSLSGSGRVHLRVYDAAGRLVATLADGRQGPGRHAVRFDARDKDAPGGVYFAELVVSGDGGVVSTARAKLVLAR
jgi:hypothetical protein